MTAVPEHFRFGSDPVFELRPRERSLLADGVAVAIAPRALDVLIVLVENAGHLVGRRELIGRVWAGVVVEENILSVQVNALRKALGSDVIETVPGYGYRFAAAPTGASGVLAPGPLRPAPLKLRTNLPATLTTLLGRDEDLATAEQMLDHHRLVSIVGAGGIGKTLLAQHLLHRRSTRHRHGVCFIALEGLADPDALPAAMASALGLALGHGDPLPALAQAVAAFDLLVALDNAEHLAGPVAATVMALLDSAPGVRIVVTSQVPLGVPPEQVYRLGPLSVPDEALPAAAAIRFGAVALFVERAQSADSRFTLDDGSTPAAIALCRTLDGLPLAIELAAWRAPTLGVTQLAAAMGERLEWLRSRDPTVAPRLQTLRAALQWSHGLLDAREKVVLRRMAVFRGSVPLDRLQRALSDAPAPGALDEWAVLDAMSTLVERSLVSRVAGTGDAVRYRLLDSPRAFAQEQLQQAGEVDAMHERHAQAMAADFERAFQHRFDGSVGVEDWGDRLRHDLDDGLAAQRWADAAGRDDLQRAILPTLVQALPYGAFGISRELTGRCVALGMSGRQDAASLYLLLAVILKLADTAPATAMTAAQHAVRIARAGVVAEHDERWLYHALLSLSTAASRCGQPAVADEALAEALAIESPRWPPQLLVRRTLAQGTLSSSSGDAQALYAAVVVQARLASEAGYNPSNFELHLIDAALAVGRAQEAVAAGRALVDRLEGSREDHHLVYGRNTLVSALLACDELAEARAVSARGWQQAVEFDRAGHWANNMALLLALEGRPRDAARVYGHSCAWYARREEMREVNEQNVARRVEGLLLASLPASEFEALCADGARLGAAAIGEIAFTPAADAAVR